MQQGYIDNYHSQDWVYRNIKHYFKTEELFSRKMCSKYTTDQLWSFLDFRLLSNLLWIRINGGKRITINSWRLGLQQRGFRSILSKIVMKYMLKGKLYASAHILGNGVDFNEDDRTAEETREFIIKNADLLPFKCRLEWKKNGKPITWVHMDCNYYEGLPKVYKFNV